VAVRPGRGAWIQVARGALTVNGTALAAGDGAWSDDERDLVLADGRDAEAVIFDLA
jgi:redox-sensitive bicupin YhaK (pirin superfamily)